jgi:hypothetical protein
MVGRLHSAGRAVELGFDIAPDDGPSGHLRHWRIVGIPDEVCAVFSKRSDEISDHIAESGHRSYRARSVAARSTRSAKRHTGADQLLPGWHAELDAAGWPARRLAAHLASQGRVRGLPFPLTSTEIQQLAAEVLDIGGDLLTRHKVFTRTHLIAELAPRLYGRDPAELDRVLVHIVASRSVVPLIQISGAREQSYTTVDVLTAEHTIAHGIESLARRPGARIDPYRIAAVVDAKERAISQALTAGQRDVVDALCGSGRAATVVVGVAGSGKTTALDAATTALEEAGYRVLGTSTSGQAARTLATEADIDASTFASLLWRLDHGSVTLDGRTIVLVDEAGMADDGDLARLTLAVERAGAGLVLVGDHRQLTAVGPGGALAAVLDRRRDLVVTLTDNVRQRNPAERHALAQLRDGDVSAAVAWYATDRRIGTERRRVDALVAMADAWAANLAAGHNAALLAWRRADVADLNRLARDHWARLGRLHGPDITMTGGRAYAVGDRVVALAPNPTAGIVTSEQLTITALTAARIDARTDDGRMVTMTGTAMDVRHLDYAYGLTAHRAQGATYERTHYLAAGGGRELAYVALSRARDRTNVYTVADDLAQAVDDLQADWGVERHQRWITHSGATIGRHPEPARAVATPKSADTPVPLEVRRAEAYQRLDALERDLADLYAGAGRWHHTPQGDTARQRNDATRRLDEARRRANAPTAKRRDRRAAARSLDGLTAALDHAERRWQQISQPTADQLRRDIARTRHDLDRLQFDALRRHLDTLDRNSIGHELPGHDRGSQHLDRPQGRDRGIGLGL